MLLAAIVLWLPSVATAADPEVGAAAPDFEFQGVEGAVYRLADYVGKRAVVLAWFPRAFTPG
jgi:peroxiredoxin Q/BCP